MKRAKIAVICLAPKQLERIGVWRCCETNKLQLHVKFVVTLNAIGIHRDAAVAPRARLLSPALIIFLIASRVDDVCDRRASSVIIATR